MNSNKKFSRDTAVKTVKMYLRENMKFPGLFFGTMFSWISGISIQKLLLPLIVAGAVDKIVAVQNGSELSWDMFLLPLLIFVLAAAVAQLLTDLGLLILSKLETRVLRKFYTQIYDHLLAQSMRFHNNSFAGSLVSQSNRFATGYVAITDNFIINFLQLIVFTVFSSVVLWIYTPLIAGTYIFWAVIFIGINTYLTVRRIPLSKARAAADTKLTGYLADSISNVGAIKTFANEDYEHKQFDRVAKNRTDKGYRYWIRSIKNDAVYGALMGMLQILVLAVSIYAIMIGQLTIGTFVLAQVYMAQAIAHLSGLSHLTKNIEQNLSDAAEMTEILDQKPSLLDPENPEKPQISSGLISVEDVTFTHSENKKALFKNLDLRIKPGEKVGLVGHSGSGKTSLTKLILRFSDVDSGAIKIDGQDIRNITQKDLRANITYVPQEPLLFHRTLAENIAYARPDATEKEIKAFAKLAHAEEFIKELPDGYDTLVGERGVKLSGGQRQRIAIARAMLKNAPILLLDEATSALDSQSEVLIQDALWKLMDGKTAIVIAHRLSTIQKMDRILVMDKGKIVEEGTHKELLNKKGVYAKLWNHQSGGFLDE